jgi:hypothetical protein
MHVDEVVEGVNQRLCIRYPDTPAEDDRSMSLLSSRHEEGAASGGADVTANALPHAVPARAVRPLRSGYALEGTDASPV